MNNMEEREQNLAVQIIRLWKRPEVRQRFKNIAALWDSFAYKGKSSEESFKDTTQTIKTPVTQAHIDAIKREVEAKISKASSIKEEIKTKTARQTTFDNGASESEFEELFFAHDTRLRALRKLVSFCYPELVEELEMSVTEINTSRTENNLEAFKAALSKTERFQKKVDVFAKTKYPVIF